MLIVRSGSGLPNFNLKLRVRSTAKKLIGGGFKGGGILWRRAKKCSSLGLKGFEVRSHREIAPAEHSANAQRRFAATGFRPACTQRNRHPPQKYVSQRDGEFATVSFHHFCDQV